MVLDYYWVPYSLLSRAEYPARAIGPVACHPTVSIPSRLIYIYVIYTVSGHPSLPSPPTPFRRTPPPCERKRPPRDLTAVYCSEIAGGFFAFRGSL